MQGQHLGRLWTNRGGGRKGSQVEGPARARKSVLLWLQDLGTINSPGLPRWVSGLTQDRALPPEFIPGLSGGQLGSGGQVEVSAH